jgi:hypothetical protein
MKKIIKRDRNIIQRVNRRKNNRIGHILPSKTCCLKMDRGRIEATGRRGRRLKQLLNNPKEKRRRN